jgi:hypothetical protein
VTLDLDTFLKLSSFALSFSAIIWTFFATRQKDTDKRFKEGSDRMDRHENRILSLEQTVKVMPGKDDLHAVQLELTRMSGTMETMSAIMEGNQKIMSRLETIVSRHEDHLLSEGRK